MLPDSNCLGIFLLTAFLTLIFLGKHNDRACSPSVNFVHLLGTGYLSFIQAVDNLLTKSVTNDSILIYQKNKISND